MITKTWTAAPAGALGLGSCGMRAHGGFGFGTGGAAVDRPAAQLQGSGLPAVRLVADLTALGGTPERLPRDFRAYDVIAHTGIQIDGTTLGSHPSRRPPS